MLNSLHNHTLTESHRYNHRESPIHSQRVTDTITESHRYNHRESPIQSQKVTDTITESHRYNHREPPISSLSSLRYRSAIAPLALRARFARARCLPQAAKPPSTLLPTRRQEPPSTHPFGVFAFRGSFIVSRFARASRSRLPHPPTKPRAKPPTPLLSSGLTALQCSPRRCSLSLAPSG